MPVDLTHHRLGRHGTLGPVGEWDCPACGVKNSGRAPELGCVHCGAGDPTKGTAGVVDPKAAHMRPTPDAPRRELEPRTGRAGNADARPSGEPQTIRVLRLIEYLITPGADVDLTLRRSLVGRMDFAWGTLTGTIVDSCDDRQEDLLGLARRQPGVWLSNETMMREQDARGGRVRLPPGGWAPENPSGRGESGVAPRPRPLNEQRQETQMDAPPDPPDTGPAFTVLQRDMARAVSTACGHQIVYTLALALQMVVEELDANMEPEKFMTRDAALAFANALMQTIPSDWDPKPQEETTDGSEA